MVNGHLSPYPLTSAMTTNQPKIKPRPDAEAEVKEENSEIPKCQIFFCVVVVLNIEIS